MSGKRNMKGLSISLSFAKYELKNEGTENSNKNKIVSDYFHRATIYVSVVSHRSLSVVVDNDIGRWLSLNPLIFARMRRHRETLNALDCD